MGYLWYSGSQISCVLSQSKTFKMLTALVKRAHLRVTYLYSSEFPFRTKKLFCITRHSSQIRMTSSEDTPYQALLIELKNSYWCHYFEYEYYSIFIIFICIWIWIAVVCSLFTKSKIIGILLQILFRQIWCLFWTTPFFSKHRSCT